MTINDFQIKNSEWLKNIISDPRGQEFLTTLASMRPTPSDSPHLHLYADAKGQVSGYEACLRNIIKLTAPPRIVAQPEINYGVSENLKPSEK